MIQKAPMFFSNQKYRRTGTVQNGNRWSLDLIPVYIFFYKYLSDLLWSKNICVLFRAPFVFSGSIHPRRAMSWQPLQTPSENVSLRFLKLANCELREFENRIPAAQPLAEPSVSDKQR